VTKAFLKSIESANAEKQPQRTILNLASVSTQNTPVTMDSYTISKVALNKFTEFLAAEHPSITSINLDPGMVATDMSNSVDLIAPFLHDTVELAAAGAVWMCSGDKKYLSGRYVSVNWDVDELEARREEIVRDNLLVEAGIRRGNAPVGEELVIQP
jgi:NAD(P)-dependent dehydrogenase (short-subunit alcohol dehydrogenase family)